MDVSMKRDLFLSYNRGDRQFAERLARDLAATGLRVWWDDWEMQVGDSLVEKIQDGIRGSSWLAIVLSPASVSSRWVKRELASALMDEILTERIKVLPLLIIDCEVPPFLRDKLFADFRESYEAGLQALLRRLAPPRLPQVTDALMSGDEGKVLSQWIRLSQAERSIYKQLLVDELNHNESSRRIAAFNALASIGDPSLELRCGALSVDASSAIRQRVAHYLGQLRKKSNLPLLEILMQDRSPAVRSAARAAFTRTTGTKP